METSEKIVEAIRPLGIPCVPDLYTGNEERYVTYNFVDDYGTDFADDEPETIVNSMQIHFFMPAKETYIDWKKRIRKALFDADFTFPEVTIQTEDENTIRHMIFECSIEE